LSGSLNDLFAATVRFIGGHFALSSLPMRTALSRKQSETRFLSSYSAAMLGGRTQMDWAGIAVPAWLI
jgi:hypothetical protein